MQPAPYHVGDQVRVTDGPFAGYEAAVRDVLRDRLRLDVRVRGMTVPIVAQFEQVEQRS